MAFLLIFGTLAIGFLQYLSPTRHARLHDAVIRAAGPMIGILAGSAVYRRAQTKQQLNAISAQEPQTAAALD